MTGAYFGIFRDYVANELNYKTDVEYRMSARGLPGFNWNWSHRPPVGGPQTTPNTAIDLATAMRRNPYLKVMSLNGYYDAATPFFSTEFDLAQMMLEPRLRPNRSDSAILSSTTSRGLIGSSCSDRLRGTIWRRLDVT